MAQHHRSAEDATTSARGSKPVWHTLTACQRCRKRKTKCDPKLPRCTPCERTNAACIYLDAGRGTLMSRGYVVELQKRVAKLERELADSEESIPVEDLVRGAGLVKIKENSESRFLGPASGIAMTRLVMELAKSLSPNRSIREIVPEEMARVVKERFESEAAKPFAKIYPNTSSVAAPGLPSIELTTQLVENFLAKAQTFYPVLHEPDFLQDVKDVYAGSTDPLKNFTLRMAIALSMHKTDVRWTSLADSFYLAALKYLEGTIRPRNLGTLQCFALIGEYSLATPTRTASYWVVGLASKLLQELRMTDEATIGCDENGNPLDPLEVDLRRRLFYVLVSMELGLAHSLGRPSAFSVTYDHKDVQFYSEVDDQYITRNGIAPEARPTMKKRMSIHFMKMRWLQLEIRHTLYLKKRHTPVDNSDPWFHQMDQKIDYWMMTYPRPEDGNGFPEEWFRVRYNTMVVFLYRPCPQVPEPSTAAVKRAFQAAVENIYLQHAQIEANSADITWIFAQQLFMAINTVLWALSYSELRNDHPQAEVTRDLETALRAIYWASTKWPGVESALILYTTLVDSCLKAYHGDATASYGVASPGNRHTTSPPSFDSPPPATNTPSTISTNRPRTGGSSLPALSRPQSLDPELPPVTFASIDSAGIPSLPPTSIGSNLAPTSGGAACSSGHLFSGTPGSQLGIPSPQFSQASFDTNGFFHPLPSPLPYSLDPTAQQASILSHMMQDSTAFMGGGLSEEAFMPSFSLFEPPMLMEGINMTQQEELMQSLETYGFEGTLNVASPRLSVS